MNAMFLFGRMSLDGLVRVNPGGRGCLFPFWLSLALRNAKVYVKTVGASRWICVFA